jgi:signal transduction histidine kinase
MRGPDAPTGGRRRASQVSMPAQASARAGVSHDGEPRRFSLANWSVSTRLAALCAMASVLGLVFGGLRISDAVDTSDTYAHTVQLAVVGNRITALAQAMEDERDRAVGFMALLTLQSTAEGNNSGGNKAGPQVLATLNADVKQEQAELASAESTTNGAAASAQTAIEGIGAGFPASIQSKAAKALNQIAYIPQLRLAFSGSQPVQNLEPATQLIGSYSGIMTILFTLDDEITTGSGDVVLGDDVRALSALSETEDQASQQRAILYGALLESALNDAGQNQKQAFNNIGGPTALGNFGGTDALTAAQSLESADQQSFEAVASTSLTQALLASSDSHAAGSANQIEDWTIIADDPTVIFPLAGGLLDLGFTNTAGAPSAWYTDMSAIIDGMRGVDNSLADQIVARSQLLQHQAFESELITAVAVVLAVLLVLLATALVARSMVNPLRRLQRDALEIATVKLPERVAAAASGSELAEADPAAFSRVEPIGVQTTDEIGAVARAFDQVHAEAVRLAGTEAQLRSNLNAMFISLSRRSVPLIDRLSRMIDNFEQNEDDPDQLSHLFSMDHLVTRMRRNSENLLVLAGEEPVRKWSEPVPLTDVARAAAAEIEQYGRVALTVQPGVMVSGQSAADVVHLLAELLENATLFSPRNTQVQVAAADAPGGGVLIEIRDEGVGVSTSRLAEMNWRLDHPPGVDVSVSRHMGLFAVSRLAARRGIRVRLRAGAPQGLTALVWLPGTLTSHEQPPTVGMHSRPQPQDVSLGEEMAFADALPADVDLQRASARHGGRHRLGLLGSAGPEEGAGAGRGYATADSGYASANGEQAANGGGYANGGGNGYANGNGNGYANGGGNGHTNGNGNGNGYANGGGYAAAGNGYASSSASGGQAGPGNGRAAGGEQRAQRSVWFAAKTPSSASAQAPSGGDEQAPAPGGNGWGQGDADWSTGGRLAGGAHYAGAYSAELAARAAGGGQSGEAELPQTRAGLPRRVPQANPGFTGQPPGRDASPESAPVLGAPPGAGPQGPRSPFSPAGGQRQDAQQAPRRRSAEEARSRVAGFQLGSRDAAQAGGNTWAAFSRGEDPPYPQPPAR